jgi:hypothetical protein
MAIPRAREEVPPPLPPPRYIGEELSKGQDPGWQWGNTNSSNNGFGGTRMATVKPGSSLLGGAYSGRVHVRENSADGGFRGREPSTSRSLDDMSSADSDEDRGKPRPTLANYR